jgi:hypothetical protein
VTLKCGVYSMEVIDFIRREIFKYLVTGVFRVYCTYISSTPSGVLQYKNMKTHL